ASANARPGRRRREAAASGEVPEPTTAAVSVPRAPRPASTGSVTHHVVVPPEKTTETEPSQAIRASPCAGSTVPAPPSTTARTPVPRRLEGDTGRPRESVQRSSKVMGRRRVPDDVATGRTIVTASRVVREDRESTRLNA